MLAFRLSLGGVGLVGNCNADDCGVATGVESVELRLGDETGGAGCVLVCGLRTNGCGRFFRMIRGGGEGK